MTLSTSMFWIIGMAVAVTAILTVGTLAAADLLPQRRTRRADDAQRGESS